MNFTKLFVGTLALSAMLAACVDDSTSAKDTDRSEEVYSDLVVETFDDLPVCSDNREGATAYVKDEKNAYMCVDGDWVPEEENSSSSIASSSSTIRNDSSSSSAMETSSSSAVESSSSSETTQSSSSSENISAGSVYDATAKTLKDLRDGKTYKTVVIGEQTWMAENLNYADSVKTPSLKGKSWCYDGVAGYCEKYGRLYTWAAAKTVCPEGWHLPSYDEWNTLFTAVGGKFTAGTALKSTSGWHLPSRDEWDTLITAVGGSSTAGTVLKSQTGWTAYVGITNEDAFGFSALPAGERTNYGGYSLGGSEAYFWSSTENGSSDAYRMYLYSYKDNAYLSDIDKNYGHSVRCLKD